MTEVRTSPESEKQGLSVFETFAPRVFGEVKPFLLLAEQSGALARLKPQQSEILVEYATADITMKELADFLGISTQAVSQRINYSIELIWKDMYRKPNGRFKEIFLAYSSLRSVKTIKK